jgi:simple sugar transport system ATP-binding protein
MNRPIYEVRGVSKRYGNVQALSNLNFNIGAGEVVGLLGDNGAGKSTLIKLMSGIIQPDQGEILVDGAAAIVKWRRDSEHIGIETIYQDTALVDTMSIVRNIFMGREIANRWGFLKHRSMRKIAVEVLRSGIHISGIDSPDR